MVEVKGMNKRELHNLRTDADSQRKRLLLWLRERPITTLAARRKLDILMPGARIHELRNKEGFNIKLHWVDEVTDRGVVHRVGKYVLHPGKWKGGRCHE